VPEIKAGLEIHQQLDTGYKLFCRCPTRLRDVRESSFEFQRVLRPTASEMGEVDVAAMEEFRRGRRFIYKAYDTTCLVENDEEPPRELNEEALDIAIEIALLLNMKVVDEVHMMRKIVIDGSNTCGFQRTAFVASDGFIETESGKVSITILCLEEDAAQIVSTGKDTATYSLDRLGIPLVEIATGADIKSPAHAREVAEHLGMVLRSTGKVKRGLGTIRQDINVSIKGGARVEIKGVQELGMIEKIVSNEASRQNAFIQMRGELERHGAKVGDVVDATFVEPKRAVCLYGFSGFEPLLEKDFYVIASKYGGALQKLQAKEHDWVVGVQSPYASEAVQLIAERARQILVGIPEDTRRALEDGTTEYMRPLPGAARMYPETDVPPVGITAERIERIKARLPKLFTMRKTEYMTNFGLNEEATDSILKGNFVLFETIMSVVPKVSGTLVARTLTSTISELRRDGYDTDKIKDDRFEQTFRLVASGRIAKEAVPMILKEIVKASSRSPEEIVRSLNLAASGDELVEVIDRILSEKKDFIKERGDSAFQPLMGLVMKELRGKVDGALISKTLRERLDKEISSQQSKK
jgi:glutamyl-tRNA(Gln) amidotransferase subunit E